MLAGCVSGGGVSANTGLTFSGVDGGIVVAQPGDGRSIGFGTNQRTTLSAMRRIVGVEPRQIPCPAAGHEAYITPEGTVAIFAGGRFVGWRQASTTGGARCS
jgi:hypothetical protein